MHHILCIIFYAMHYMRFIPCIIFFAMYSLICIFCIILYALTFMHCIIYSIFYSLCSMYCNQFIVFYALPPVGQPVVLFALNANCCVRAPVLSALLIVLQAWSTMKIPLKILTKIQEMWL